MKRTLFPPLACLALLAGAVPAPAEPWAFAVFCDGRTALGQAGGKDGVNVTALHAVAADVAAQGVSLVVFPGDLVNGSSSFGPLARQFATWREAMAPLYSAGVPVYVSRGNHELGQDSPKGASLAAWRAAFPDLPKNGPAGQEGLTYAVTRADAEFIAVDQFIGIRPGADPGQHDSAVNQGMVSPWVLDRVRRSAARWVFVFGHESAFIGHHEDCMGSFPEERDALWDALGERGGVYLTGHDHMYVRQTAPDAKGRKVLELVVGCAGATPYPLDNAGMNAQFDRHVVPEIQFVNARAGGVPNTGGLPMYFGYVLITVDGGRLTGRWRALTNYNTETFTGPVAPAEPRFETLDTFTWPGP
jgi:hypothetical protein